MWPCTGPGIRALLPGSQRRKDNTAHRTSSVSWDRHTCSSGEAKLSLARRSEGDFSRAVFNSEPLMKSVLRCFWGSDLPALGGLCWRLRCQVGPTLHTITLVWETRCHLGTTVPSFAKNTYRLHCYLCSALTYTDLLKHCLILSHKDHRYNCQF